MSVHLDHLEITLHEARKHVWAIQRLNADDTTTVEPQTARCRTSSWSDLVPCGPLKHPVENEVKGRSGSGANRPRIELLHFAGRTLARTALDVRPCQHDFPGLFDKAEKEECRLQNALLPPTNITIWLLYEPTPKAMAAGG